MSGDSPDFVALDWFHRFPFPSSNNGENVAKMGSRKFKVKVCSSWELPLNRIKYDVAREAFEEWLVSAPHRANIEGDFNACGIAVKEGENFSWYLVALFAKWEPHKLDVVPELVTQAVCLAKGPAHFDSVKGAAHQVVV